MKKKLTAEQLADATRLKELFESKKKQLSISQETLAEEIGKTQSAISHYLNGINALNLEMATYFAQKLGVQIADFSPSLEKQARNLVTVLYGNNVAFSDHPQLQKQYPLLDWASAGHWCEEPATTYNSNRIEKRYETVVECSQRAFWLEVKGDSMTSPNGLSIPSGMIILIDPEIKPTINKLVVAKLDGEKELTFKQLITEGYDKFLKPLNPQYNMIPLNNHVHIVGVVVEAKVDKLP
ncbi:LexA family protein [Xenorhabdus koppenhoeferi]|uniref:Phage repressor protein. Serine peptidase. MEROPS family S24 n=1 Tax=Xenorhabdus koppenhoeferi TaxID=351659 RepID=A0A1I7EWQ4_9GAMM|nr:XRE family transcriptional regulator [Xenorhabdus koppenhoeferi]SFU28342.1 phage repressor protein. Serine peptidase. MEROPS family S24 [Xenorhabdus koppenhoeferi]